MPNNAISPGSDEAVAAGCKCPRMDNRYGKGLYIDTDGKAQFVINEACPLHGIDKADESEVTHGV